MYTYILYIYCIYIYTVWQSKKETWLTKKKTWFTQNSECHHCSASGQWWNSKPGKSGETRFEVYLYNCLVVDLPPWKIWVKVSWDDDIPNIWKIIQMFQTTNQIILYTNDIYEHLRYTKDIYIYISFIASHWVKSLLSFPGFPRLCGPIERAIDQGILIDDRLRYRPKDCEISGRFVAGIGRTHTEHEWQCVGKSIGHFAEG